MEKTNYYAIVDSIVEGAFSEDYVITVGRDRREFNVHKSSLRRTRGGQTAAHIDITKRGNGTITGFVTNCEDGATEEYLRTVPIDSLCEKGKTLEFL